MILIDREDEIVVDGTRLRALSCSGMNELRQD